MEGLICKQHYSSGDIGKAPLQCEANGKRYAADKRCDRSRRYPEDYYNKRYHGKIQQVLHYPFGYSLNILVHTIERLALLICLYQLPCKRNPDNYYQYGCDYPKSRVHCKVFKILPSFAEKIRFGQNAAPDAFNKKIHFPFSPKLFFLIIALKVILIQPHYGILQIGTIGRAACIIDE